MAGPKGTLDWQDTVPYADTPIPVASVKAQDPFSTSLTRAGRPPVINGEYIYRTGANDFRRLGGKVVAYYYGEWNRRGMSYNNFPWKWFRNYQDRLPIASVPLPSNPSWNFQYQQAQGWTGQNGTLALPGWQDVTSNWTNWTNNDGTYTVNGTVVTFTATSGTNPTFSSPTSPLLSLDGTLYRRIRFFLKRLSPAQPQTAWEGKLFFTTAAEPSFDENKTVRFAEPNWDINNEAEVIITVPDTQTRWIGQTIQRIRFDFWQVGNVNWQILNYIQTDRLGGAFIDFQSTGTDPQLFSPDRLDMYGSELTTITIRLRRVAGSGWDGRVYFITNADTTYDLTKSFVITEPTWTGIPTITVTTSGNATWVAGVIRRLRFDFGNSAADRFELHDVTISQAPALERFNNECVGLPATEQWAVDWEIRQAFEHGIDAFAHNFYWNQSETLGLRNFAKDVTDLHFMSVAETRFEHCLQWSNGDAVNPFSNTAQLPALWDEWDRYFKYTNYWRINGQPVVFIFSPANLGTWMASASMYNLPDFRLGLQRFIQEANSYFRTKTGSAAPNGVYFVSQAGTVDPNYIGRTLNAISNNEFAGFSAIAEYNFIGAPISATQNTSGGTLNGQVMQSGTLGSQYPSNVNQDAVQSKSFSQLRESYMRNNLWVTSECGNVMPFMVPSIGGWDYRPWLGYNTLGANFSETWNSMPSTEQFGAHLRDMRDIALNRSALSPASGPVVTIAAWNEYAEGNFICPTRRYGWGLLEKVLETFGTAHQ